MAGTEADRQAPRAMVHKRILDEASERPEASMRELSDEIAGASTNLVERVLNEYGDPAGDAATPDGGDEMAESKTTPTDTDVESETEGKPSVAELSEKEHETLRVIHERPTATQEEIGKTLGVSAATVCNRLGDIPGFEWGTRREFVEELFQSEAIGDGVGQAEHVSLTQIEDRVDEVERQLSAVPSNGSSRMFDPELALKVIKACLGSEQFSPDEELELLQVLFGGTAPAD